MRVNYGATFWKDKRKECLSLFIQILEMDLLRGFGRVLGRSPREEGWGSQRSMAGRWTGFKGASIGMTSCPTKIW
jgi:hypothetical protein